MFILAIDTATNSGGVALSRNAEVLALLMLKAPLRYSESLIQMVDFVLTCNEIQISDVNCLAVSTGPGSFTGLRIGLATVKGLSQATRLPVVGIPTLKALAWRFHPFASRVVPMIDARRQQVYAAVAHCTETGCDWIEEEAVAPPAQWLRSLGEGEHLFAGDGAQLYRETIRAMRPESRVIESDNCILGELCRLAYRSYAAGEAVSAEQIHANYIRPSDANGKDLGD